MICEEALLLMSARLDGALSADEEAALAAHLDACPACAALMESMRGLDAQVATLRESAPEGLKKGVLYRIDQATGKAKPPRRRAFGPGAAFGAVAAVLVLLVGLNVFSLPFGEKATQSLETIKQPACADVNIAAAYKDAINDLQMKAAEEFLPESAVLSGAAETQADQVPLETDFAGTVPVETGEAASQHLYRYASETAGSTGGKASPTAEPEAVCAQLSREQDAAVLYYADFDAQSLLGLLETEEPALYATLAELAPETQDGLLCYKTDCGTVLAIQEWLLSQLPHETDMDAALLEAETRMMSEMETLDPGSESLYRIITWAPKDHPIRWPETWPEDWADRLRTGAGWALFFPDEDFVPNADKTAYLVFRQN